MALLDGNTAQRRQAMAEIKELRTKLNMTQTEFAEHFHIKIDTLRMWEQGVNKCPQHVKWMLQRIIELERLEKL